jgi:hypothetical protein
VHEIVATVGRTYGIPSSHVLDKSHAEAYWVAIFPIRRTGNLSLDEVAGHPRVSPVRISQIQTKIERAGMSARMVQVLGCYKLKN